MNIKIDNTKAVALITAIAHRAANPLEANKIISNKMRQDVLDHFKEESDEEGRWADLKPATWKWKKEHGYRKMLQNTGKLREGNLPEATNRQAKVVNRMSYAKKQNEGEGATPARKFLWLSDSMMDRILKIMTNYIVRHNLTEGWT